jgi:hypothetical protein
MVNMFAEVMMMKMMMKMLNANLLNQSWLRLIQLLKLQLDGAAIANHGEMVRTMILSNVCLFPTLPKLKQLLSHNPNAQTVVMMMKMLS